jgi:hypothetical protein
LGKIGNAKKDSTKPQAMQCGKLLDEGLAWFG